MHRGGAADVRGSGEDRRAPQVRGGARRDSALAPVQVPRRHTFHAARPFQSQHLGRPQGDVSPSRGARGGLRRLRRRVGRLVARRLVSRGGRAAVPAPRGKFQRRARRFLGDGAATTPRRRRGDSVGSRQRRGDAVEIPWGRGGAGAKIPWRPGRLRLRGASVESAATATTWSFRGAAAPTWRLCRDRVGRGSDVDIPWRRGDAAAPDAEISVETRAQVLRVAHHGQPLARREPPRGLANPLGQRGRAGRVGAVALLLRVLVTFAARDPFPKIPSGETSRDDDDDDDDDDDADRQRSHASGTSSTARRTT